MTALVLLFVAGLAGAGVLGGLASGGNAQAPGCGGAIPPTDPQVGVTGRALAVTVTCGAGCTPGFYCIPRQTLNGGLEGFCEKCKSTVCNWANGSQACVDLATSRTDCGACNTMPPSSNSYCSGGQYQICRDSLCTAAATTSTICANLASDKMNCGTCNVACAASEICHLGRCTAECFDTWCGPKCIALDVDLQNCGACGNRCSAGQICSGGQCTPCTGTICGNECVPLATDHDNCGACGRPCDESQICANGACQTPPCAKSVCGGACVDTASDDRNCGGCASVCPNGSTCSAGSCASQYVTLPICDEFKNAVKLAELAYADNANLAVKLAALPTGSFRLIKTYRGDESQQGHALLASSTYNGKTVCYAAFRGSREADLVSYVLMETLADSGEHGANPFAQAYNQRPYWKCKTVGAKGSRSKFANCSHYVYSKYWNLATDVDLGNNSYKTLDANLIPTNETGIAQDLAELATAGRCNGGVRIVGHSVGGALASLLAAELYTDYPNQFTKSYMKVITFGEVRAMKLDDANRFHAAITKYRVMNKHDFASSMAPRGLGYSHWGSAKKIKEGGRNIVDEEQDFAQKIRLNKEPHLVDTYVRRIAQCDCSDSGSGSGCASGNNVCGVGLAVCANTCRDLKTDETNCGACGTVCVSGKSCLSGVCACDTGETFCNGACQDLQNDPLNCGACGSRVATGNSCCNGTSVNYLNNPSHCGGCDIPCATGESCCDGGCADFKSDDLNCGGCGVRCGSNEICCNSACKDVSSDPGNCGSCGKSCGINSTCCNFACTDIKVSTQSCGACGTSCGLNAECINSTCRCPPGKSCTSCPAGLKPIAGNKCTGCPAGQALDAGNVCLACPAGTFRERPDQAACIACPAGSYQNQSGKSFCVLCAIGQYQDQSGQTSCPPCPPGSAASPLGATGCAAPESYVVDAAADTYVQHDNTGPYGSGTQIHVKNAGTGWATRKGLIRFAVANGAVASASLLLDVSYEENTTGGSTAATFFVWGIKDGSAASCGESFTDSTVKYNDLSLFDDSADGVSDGSACLHDGDSAQAGVQALGTFSITVANLNQTVSFSTPALAAFLSQNTNGVVTFALTRAQNNGQLNTSFAASEHASLRGPRLTWVAAP